MPFRKLGLNAESNLDRRLYRTAINQLNYKHLLLIRNRRKNLLRDHRYRRSTETCPLRLPISAVTGTLSASAGQIDLTREN